VLCFNQLIFVLLLTYRLGLPVTMRHHQRKTDRGSASKETMMAAARAVIDNGASLRQTAKTHNVHYSTLCRYIQKVKSAREASVAMPNPGYKPNRRIFSDEQEGLIADYLVTCRPIMGYRLRKHVNLLSNVLIISM
jgi:transposase-like protein